MKIRTMRLLSREGISNVVKNKLMSLASITTVLIALLLLGLVLLVAVNVNSNMEHLRRELEVVIFLEVDVNPIDREAVKGYIEEREAAGDVSQWRYEDKQTAYDTLKKDFADPALLKGITAAQMAESFYVRLTNPDNGETFLKPLYEMPGIQPQPDGINYPQTTLSQITRFADIISSVTLVLMGVMLVIAVFIISNTIRLTVLSRSREIEIMKHVGALDSFIRMPFFVEGIVIGILGSVVAFLLTFQGYAYLREAFNVMMTDLGLGLFQLVPFDPMSFRIIVMYVLIGVAVGGTGSLISVRKYLKV